jgi:hypothetical protein
MIYYGVIINLEHSRIKHTTQNVLFCKKIFILAFFNLKNLKI